MLFLSEVKVEDAVVFSIDFLSFELHCTSVIDNKIQQVICLEKLINFIKNKLGLTKW